MLRFLQALPNPKTTRASLLAVLFRTAPDRLLSSLIRQLRLERVAQVRLAQIKVNSCSSTATTSLFAPAA